MSAIRPFRNISQMLDASIAGLATRDAFMWNGSAWVNRPLESADISDATALAAPDTLALRDSSGVSAFAGVGLSGSIASTQFGGQAITHNSAASITIGGSFGAGPITLTPKPSYPVTVSGSHLVVDGAIYAGSGLSIDGDVALLDPGVKIGTATTQKLGFFNATPIVQPANTTDLRQLLIDLGLLASGGASPLNLNGGTLTAATVSAGNVTATTTLRGPYKGSGASTATLGDGYNGGMDMTFANAGIFRMTELNQTGTNDVFFQLIPATSAGYATLEAWTAAGLILGTGNNANPVIFRVNRTEVARLNASELLLGNGVDLVGDGFYNIKGNSSGGGRIDIRADQVLCFGTFSPQGDIFMGNQGTPNSYTLGWTGQLTGAYRSIYSRYAGGLASTSGDLVFLAQWYDGSWDHEIGRWNDHGTLTLTEGLEVDTANAGYGIQFGTNAYNQILESDGLEVRAADYHRFINGASTEVMRVNGTSLLIGQTSDDSAVAPLQVSGRIHCSELGVGSASGATSYGSAAYAMPIFDRGGNQLGYVPIYDSYSA